MSVLTWLTVARFLFVELRSDANIYNLLRYERLQLRYYEVCFETQVVSIISE